MKTINNNIEEQRVSFDNAKLLKKRGFDVRTHYWFHRDTKKLEYNNLLFSMNNLTENYSAPTQQLALDWIRINFNIFITINKSNYSSYEFDIIKGMDSLVFEDRKLYRCFNSPEEAKEEAINYVLNNLI